MKLVFYSGGQQKSNQKLHQELVDLTGKTRRISFTYIPFCSDGAEVFYGRAVRRYKRFGVSRFECLLVDGARPPSRDEIRKAFDSDVIYLAGGNTFYFLKYLKQRNLLDRLRKYVLDGGVLAGLSAGAHIMTPHIGLAGLAGLDPDKNEVKLRSLSALGLVDFEFMPHFDPSARKIRLLRKHSASHPNPIYACSDGGGIVIDGDRFSVYGKTSVFHRGDWIELMFGWP